VGELALDAFWLSKARTVERRRRVESFIVIQRMVAVLRAEK
jgi:hypothetical protein